MWVYAQLFSHICIYNEDNNLDFKKSVIKKRKLYLEVSNWFNVIGSFPEQEFS